jgi:hypothetical protein
MPETEEGKFEMFAGSKNIEGDTWKKENKKQKGEGNESARR